MIDRTLIIFLTGVTVFLSLMMAIFAWGRPEYTDEALHLGAIRHFSGSLTIQKLRDYPEINGPLMFVVYSKVGDLVGFDLWKFRLVNLVLSIAACAFFFLTLRELCRSRLVAVLVAALLVVNPYWIRLSIYAFVDMTPLLFMMIFLWLVVRGRNVLPIVLGAAMILCRQFFVFLLAGTGAFYAAKTLGRPDRRLRSASTAGGYLLALVPFGLLALLWHGIHPPHGAVYIPPGEPLYHPGYLTAYVLLIPAFTAPLLLFRLKPIYGSVWTMAAAFVLSGWYALFPVHLSRHAAVGGTIPAIGVVHRFAQIITRNSTVDQHVVLWLVFLAGIPVVFFLVRDSWRRIAARRFDFALMLDLQILAFLVIMPFPWHIWEKYILPLVPLLLLRLLLIGNEPEEGAASAAPAT